MALAEAHIHGLVFGRDIVFTYGPLAYLAIGAGTAATYRDMLVASLFLAALTASLAVYATMEDGWFLGKLGFVAAVLVCLPLVLPLDTMMLVLIVAWTLPQFRSGRDSQIPAYALGLLSGVALLLKFNVGLAAFAVGLTLFALRAWTRRRFASSSSLETLLLFVLGVQTAASFWFARLDYGLEVATALLFVALVSSLVFAKRSGPRRWIFGVTGVACACALAASPSYRMFIGSSLQLAFGYSSAMSLDGAEWQLGFVLCVFALIVLSLVANIKQLTFPVAAALSVALFFGFKEGFVRQDLHVVYAFWTALVVAGVLLRLSAGRRLQLINVAVVLLTFFALDVVVRGDFGADALATLTVDSVSRDFSRFSGAWHSDLTVEQVYLELQGDRLPPSVIQAIGRSSVDVQPWETSIVFANDLVWDPEPIFQAYSAFTPVLDRLNARHIDSAGANRILFHWNAIDGRHPLWDAPAATREIVCRYAPDPAFPRMILTESGQELLEMKNVPNRCDKSIEVSAGTYSWRQGIHVPPSKGLLFMTLAVRYSPLGEILKTIFRAPAIWLRVFGPKGEESKYRIVVANAGDGLLVGPFPQSLGQLRSLLTGGSSSELRTVELDTDAEYFFQSSFPVTFSRVSYK